MSEGDTNINKPKRKLVIKEGSEFKIKVEGLEEFNDSFFKDIYDSAVVNAVEIVNNTKKYYSAEEKFKKDKEEANNIIAFVGERGTGKSSAMVSFAEALKDINDKGTDLDKPGFEKFKKLKDVSFVNLDIIDPALLEDKESIFEIIIAKMFSKFKEQMEKQSDTLEYDDKKRLLKKFQNVYMDLKTINTDRKDMFKESPYGEDIIETLVSLASGSNMRKSFIELVNEFLKMFAGKENGNNRFLVIPIDDLDMNIKHSAEMAEQIRKYLMVPNVIVLMAIKMGQLKDSIEQMYRKNYAIMLKEGNLSDDPKEMAERYIEKLIPNGRKLYLPDIRAHKNGIEEDIELIFENSIYKSKGDSIEDTVLKMTYEKTGLIFIKNDYDVHYLVPDNLRELQNYLIMLNKMDDIKLIPNDDEQDKVIRLHNIEKFETYFLKNWAKRNLPRKYTKIIDEFYNTSINKKNKYIVNAVTDEIYIKFLRKEYSYNALDRTQYIDKISSEKEKSTIKSIVSLSNNTLNISFGDVLAVLNVYDEYLNNEEYKKFIFAIKTLYSILFYKILKININLNNAKILMGGNIINTALLKQFSEKFMFYQFGCYRKLKISKNDDNSIKEFMDKVVKKPESLTKDSGTTQLMFKKFELINYFTFFCKDETKIRENNEEYYEIDSQLGFEGDIGINNIMISPSAFITKLLDPKDVIEKMINSYKAFEDVEDIRQEAKFKKIYDASISKKIKENKIVIPIYSVELLEKIMEDACYNFRKKFKNTRTLPYFFRSFFKVVYKSINDNYNEICKIFKLNKADNFKKDFCDNSIITKIFEIDEKKKSLKIKEDIKSILDYIEAQEKEYELQKENFKDIYNNIKMLSDRITYFKKEHDNDSTRTIISNAKAIYNDGTKKILYNDGTKKIRIKSNFSNEFVEKITTWVNGISKNSELNNDGKKIVSQKYIEKLTKLLEEENEKLKKQIEDNDIDKKSYNGNLIERYINQRNKLKSDVTSKKDSFQEKTDEDSDTDKNPQNAQLTDKSGNEKSTKKPESDS